MDLSSPPTTSGLNVSPPPTGSRPSLSSAPRSSGLMNEPPLSPGGPAPASPSPTPAPSLEAQVVRLGLMTTAEVATTMQEEAETGRSFAELAVEHGRIDPGDLARLTEAEAPAPPAPELQLAPAPPTPAPPALEPVEPSPPVLAVSEPEPLVEAVADQEPIVTISLEPPASLAPAAKTTANANVFVRLTSGERVSAGEFEGQEAAERRARELMIAIDAHGDWPCVDGRFIKPDAVVSIDVDLPTA